LVTVAPLSDGKLPHFVSLGAPHSMTHGFFLNPQRPGKILHPFLLAQVTFSRGLENSSFGFAQLKVHAKPVHVVMTSPTNLNFILFFKAVGLSHLCSNRDLTAGFVVGFGVVVVVVDVVVVGHSP
jgi:hypothetical protein